MATDVDYKITVQEASCLFRQKRERRLLRGGGGGHFSPRCHDCVFHCLYIFTKMKILLFIVHVSYGLNEVFLPKHQFCIVSLF